MVVSLIQQKPVSVRIALVRNSSAHSSGLISGNKVFRKVFLDNAELESNLPLNFAMLAPFLAGASIALLRFAKFAFLR
jgi:hypothetical protein